MIRLVVSDLDGTLMPYGEKGISESVLSRINTIIDSGVTFAVSSGRTYNELLSCLPTLSDRIYFICCDGALCVYGGKVLYARQIAAEDIGYLFKQSGISYVFHGATVNYRYGSLPSEADCFDGREITGVFGLRERIFKVTAYGGEIKLPAYSGLRTHWDGGVYSCTQLVNRYCDKGAALSDLMTRLMLTKYDTACIGDSGNDIAMMKGAKYSFCVSERCWELASVCAFKTDRVTDALDYVIENCK